MIDLEPNYIQTPSVMAGPQTKPHTLQDTQDNFDLFAKAVIEQIVHVNSMKEQEKFMQ